MVAPMEKYNFVLIRGLARESGHWGSFLKELQSKDYCLSVTGLDLPGAGVYHKISSPLTIRENAEFLVSKLKEKNLDDGNLVIVSVSLGSMVAIEMAYLYPHLFKKVYLMNTSVSGLSPIHHRLQLQAMKRFYKILGSRSLENRELEVLKMVSNKEEDWSKNLKDWVTIAKERPIKPQNFLRQLLAASYYRLPNKKPETAMVVLNSKADRMVHYSCSEKLSKKWSLPIYTNLHAGHELALDDPEWVLERLQETL